MPRRSRYADAESALLAVTLVQPAIEVALRDPQVSERGVLHLVLMDPASSPGDTSFDDAIALEHSIGERSRWDVDYAAYARAKARASWRHASDTRRLMWMQPHRLAEEDGLAWGGIWLDGIVVAASGAMPAWDEAFSLSIAGHWRALVLQRAEAERDARDRR